MRIAMIDVPTINDIDDLSPKSLGYKGNHLELIAEAASHNPDILLVPEFFLYAPGRQPYTKDEKDAILQQISETAGRDDNLIIPGTMVWQNQGNIYNTAPVFVGREKVREHKKCADRDTELIGVEFGLELEEGTHPCKPIEWRGRQVGLEVCVEHKLGLFANSGAKTDLHIVVGCNGELLATYNTARRVLRKKYMLLCDGFKDCRANPGNGMFRDDIKPEKQGKVLLYEIEG